MKKGVIVRQGESQTLRQWGLSRNDSESAEGRLIPAIFESQGRRGPLFVQETQRCAQIFAKRYCEGGALSEARVHSAFLRRWRQRLGVSLQRGNAAIIRACVGHHKPQVSPPPPPPGPRDLAGPLPAALPRPRRPRPVQVLLDGGRPSR